MLSEKTYLVPAYIQKDLDVLMVKLPEPVQRFQGKKVLISLAPDSMQKNDAGAVDVSLEAAPEMMAFYSSEAVFNACGGTKGMRAWIALTNTHQCQLADDKFCHHEKIIWESPLGALQVCWYHDPSISRWAGDGEYAAKVNQVLDQFRRKYVIETMRSWLEVPAGRPMSLYEVLWFAVSQGLTTHLPDALMAKMAGYKEPKPEPVLKLGDKPDYWERFRIPEKREDYVKQGRLRLAEQQQKLERAVSSVPALDARTEKAVKTLRVDPEPPASFMLKPKRIRWVCEKYTQWVKTQPCVCCGAQADDPHHLIGYGLGGMGTKAHDIFTIPLCRQHHDELHRDPRSWAKIYGEQLLHVFRTIDMAFSTHVIE